MAGSVFMVHGCMDASIASNNIPSKTKRKHFQKFGSVKHPKQKFEDKVNLTKISGNSSAIFLVKSLLYYEG